MQIEITQHIYSKSCRKHFWGQCKEQNNILRYTSRVLGNPKLQIKHINHIERDFYQILIGAANDCWCLCVCKFVCNYLDSLRWLSLFQIENRNKLGLQNEDGESRVSVCVCLCVWYGGWFVGWIFSSVDEGRKSMHIYIKCEIFYFLTDLF